MGGIFSADSSDEEDFEQEEREAEQRDEDAAGDEGDDEGDEDAAGDVVEDPVVYYPGLVKSPGERRGRLWNVKDLKDLLRQSGYFEPLPSVSSRQDGTRIRVRPGIRESQAQASKERSDTTTKNLEEAGELSRQLIQRFSVDLRRYSALPGTGWDARMTIDLGDLGVNTFSLGNNRSVILENMRRWVNAPLMLADPTFRGIDRDTLLALLTRPPEPSDDTPPASSGDGRLRGQAKLRNGVMFKPPRRFYGE